MCFTAIMSIYLLIFLASGCLYVQAEDTSSEDKDDGLSFTERLENVIEHHCMENANETAYQEAIEGLHQVKCNWVIALPEKRLYGRELYRYCLENSQNFSIYLNEFVEKLSPCLDPEEEYLKKFIMDSYGNYNHYFCKELSVSDATKNRMKNCTTRLELSEVDPSIVCFEESKIFAENATIPAIITKLDFCQDIKTIYSCFADTFREHCPTAPEIEEFATIFMKQSLANCYGVLPNLRIKYQ